MKYKLLSQIIKILSSNSLSSVRLECQTLNEAWAKQAGSRLNRNCCNSDGGGKGRCQTSQKTQYKFNRNSQGEEPKCARLGGKHWTHGRPDKYDGLLESNTSKGGHFGEIVLDLLCMGAKNLHEMLKELHGKRDHLMDWNHDGSSSSRTRGGEAPSTAGSGGSPRSFHVERPITLHFKRLSEARSRLYRPHMHEGWGDPTNPYTILKLVVGGCIRPSLQPAT